ncbi:MAG: hypothetical protein JXQ29_10845 [Planctomycetes bacterium]|nr:hypothetical protein [Planctomycetota bacterium]
MQRADAVLVHYAELGQKGPSRRRFEDMLRCRIDDVLRPHGAQPARAEPGRLTVGLAGADIDGVIDALRRLPGIAWFAPMHRLPRDMEAFKEAIVALARHDTGSFRVSVKRADRRFPVTSMEVARQMGAALVVATDRPVALKGFDHHYALEIGERAAYLYAGRISGLGGLPSGVNGDALVLLSGGVDSAVAAQRMICRGTTVHPLHFHHAAICPGRAADRAERMAAALSRLQGELTLRRIDFAPVHDAVGGVVAPEFRAVVHRRMMLRIGERLRRDQGWALLVTGDVVGQSAAQTAANLEATLDAVAAPVLTPVAGDNRDGLLRDAGRLGLLDVAALPYEDCVYHRAARNPGYRTTPADFAAAEAALDVAALVAAACERVEILAFRFGERVSASADAPGGAGPADPEGGPADA